MKDIEQNHNSSKFAVTYYDDGQFKIRTFGKGNDAVLSEDMEEEQKNECMFNKLLDIDKSTEAIDNFPHPMSCCCFIDDNTIFVSLFHNQTLTHYHFLYHIKSKTISELKDHHFNANVCSEENFPQKCFYNKTQGEIYTFYR